MEIKNRFFSKTEMTAFFTGLILVFVFLPFANGNVAAPFRFRDNFFNTLKIVENFKQTGIPSFDGTTPTNDFSPLWGLTLYGISSIVPIRTTAFFILVRSATGLALGASLWLFNRLIDALGFKPEPQARFLVLSFLATSFIYTSAAGTDTAFAIPFVFLNALCLLKTLRSPSVKTGAVYGICIFLCALARFDSLAFFVTTALVFYFQFDNKHPVTTKQFLTLLGGLIIGLLPLLFRFFLSKTTFGTFVPAELESWTEAQDHAPWRLMTVLFVDPVRHMSRTSGALVVLTFSALLSVLTAYASFPWTEREQKPEDTVFYSLIWYPVLTFAVIGIFTFISLPEYAFYPLAVGGTASLLFVTCRINEQLKEREELKENRKACLVWFVLGVCLSCLSILSTLQPKSAVYIPVAKALSEFTEQNEGTYAMSSGAGILSYLTKARFVRLDGMAADKRMLEFIRTQSDLKTVLKHYNADYLVVFNPVSAASGCYSVREPAQNRFGGSNKGMSDWLCKPPVFEKQIAPKLKIGVFKVSP